MIERAVRNAADQAPRVFVAQLPVGRQMEESADRSGQALGCPGERSVAAIFGGGKFCSGGGASSRWAAEGAVPYVEKANGRSAVISAEAG